MWKASELQCETLGTTVTTEGFSAWVQTETRSEKIKSRRDRCEQYNLSTGADSSEESSSDNDGESVGPGSTQAEHCTDGSDKFHNWFDEQGGPLEDMMVDSGASTHLLDPNRIRESMRKDVRRLKRPIVMQTANGPSTVAHCIKLYVEELGTNCTFLLKRGAPTIVSVGNLVLRTQNPYEFHWDQKVNSKNQIAPYLVTSEGTDIDLIVQNATPSSFSRLFPSTDPTANAMKSELPSDNETDGEAESDWYEQYLSEDETIDQFPNVAPNVVVDGSLAERPDAVEDIPPPPEISDKELKARINSRRRRSRKKFGQRLTGNDHNILTHYPKDPNCDICCRTKATREAKPPRTDERQPDAPKPPEKFGDAITCDHQILIKEHKGARDAVSLVVQDISSYWLQSYPAPTKSAEEITKALPRFLVQASSLSIFTAITPRRTSEHSQT